MGQADYYLAALKGALLSSCLDIQLVDIATSIAHHHLKQAAYILRNAYPYFPATAIHIMNVNAVEAKGKMLCVKHKEQYFILFDNGCVPLLFGGIPAETYHIHNDVSESSNLLYAEGISNVINAITSGLGLTNIGTVVQQVKEQRWMLPQSSSGMIKGTIQYIDSYGNAITNITKELYDQCIGDKKMQIQFGSYILTEIHKSYNDVSASDEFCFFNAEGKLEIALNKFIAGNMLSLKVDTSIILIEAVR